MRLLYLADAMAVYGGIERVLADKMNWLAENSDFDVYLLTADQGNSNIVFPLHPSIIYQDLGICFFRQYKTPIWKRWLIHRNLHRLFQQRLKDKITEILPDIIICTRIDYIRDIERVKGNIPLLFESHSSCLSSVFGLDGWLRRIRIWYQKKALKNKIVVVALTKGDAAEWKKLTQNVLVIPNVVNINDKGRVLRRTTKSIIYVGRDTMQKDLDSLMLIWKYVFLKHPDWQLHIYGKTHRTASGVVVHEPKPLMYDAYTNASILLLTSVYEPFGLVLPEAMSYGIPVVAFDCPYGPAEIINDGVDGYVVKNHDLMKFVDRVCELVEDEKLRMQMGNAGLQSSQKYRADIIMPQWIKLFEKIVGGSN